MRKFVVFTALSLFLVALTLTQTTAFSRNLSVDAEKAVAIEEVASECASIQEFFQSLDVNDALLLNSVLQYNYVAGYHSEVLRHADVAHHDTVSMHLATAEGQLKKLRSGRKYETLLSQARGEDKHHLIRFIVGRRNAGMVHGRSDALRKWVHKTSPTLSVDLNVSGPEYRWGSLFFGGIYVATTRGYRHHLEAKDVFPPPVHRALKPAVVESPAQQKSKRFDFSISAAEVNKIALVSLLLLAAMAVIAGFIGICFFPNVPAFRRVRILLDQR